MAELSITDLSADIRAAIAELKNRPEIESVGVVTRVGDGIAWIYGLSAAGYNEMLEVDGVDGQKVTAFALNLADDEIGAVILGDTTQVKAGAPMVPPGGRTKASRSVLPMTGVLPVSTEPLCWPSSHRQAKR